jgi:hypothetical protein
MVLLLLPKNALTIRLPSGRRSAASRALSSSCRDYGDKSIDVNSLSHCLRDCLSWIIIPFIDFRSQGHR